ncbi:hypothetical protein PINS_up008276 [Pythium insidiosum]|nr:hypothetical protein PINS_up008276 [Pythium insidiosum]
MQLHAFSLDRLRPLMRKDSRCGSSSSQSHEPKTHSSIRSASVTTQPTKTSNINMRLLTLATLVLAASTALVAADGSGSKSHHRHVGSHEGDAVGRPPHPPKHRPNGSHAGSWDDVPHDKREGSGSMDRHHKPKKPRACGPPPHMAGVDGSGSGSGSRWNHTRHNNRKHGKGKGPRHHRGSGSHDDDDDSGSDRMEKELFDCNSSSDASDAGDPRVARSTPVPAPTSGAASPSMSPTPVIAIMATTCAAFAALV